MTKSEVAHKPTPAAKDEISLLRSIAEQETIKHCPIAKIKKPAAATSWPLRKK